MRPLACYDICVTPEREQSPQEKLIRSELELGLTLVQLARAERKNRNTDASVQAILRAKVIISNVQRFFAVLKTDCADVKAELDGNLKDLQSAMDSFSY
jgi:hypothetical protein